MTSPDAVLDMAAAARRAPAPVLDDVALHGLAGAYVRLVAPHTEAAPAAILACTLATLGALIGRGPSWRFGSDDHHARLFVLLVGPTGAGRKGTAIGLGVRRLARAVDADFAAARLASGLSSAEGLVAEVRDPIPDRTGPTGKPIPGDPGVPDKRLLVVEDELAGALEAMAREGNRLSAVLRDAWDGRDLRTLVKRDPQRATGPHVCVVAGITPAELGATLRAVAVKNGLANRLLPIWCARVRLLAHDTAPDPRDVDAITGALARAVDRARRLGALSWAPDAADAWATLYPSLAVVPDTSPTLRALLERGAPYVRRLAMLFALLDGTAVVGSDHLAAAVALWQYAAGTWRCVFAESDALSPLSRRLLDAITNAGAAGCSRSELRRAAGSNDIPAELIAGALHELASLGLVVRERVPTAGRPREVWRHARHVGAPFPAREERDEREESPPDADAFLPSLPFLPVADDDAGETFG